MPDQLFGDFDYHTVVGTFEPRLEEMLPHDARFGLNLQVQYIYGGFTTADGAQYIVERKFIGPMTGGLWLMSTVPGTLKLDMGALRSTRGETKREFTEGRRVWGEHLMHKLGQATGGNDQPLTLDLNGDKIMWSEGDLLSLEGTLAGPGFQFYAPMRNEPLFYTTHAYWVKGTALGVEVEGFIGFDHGYWQHGREWKEYRIFHDIEVSWEVFGNQFEDGSTEWGVIVKGRGDMSAAVVFEDDRIMGRTNHMPARYDLDDEGFINEGVFTIGDDEWAFTGNEAGRMHEFSNARWAGYRAQSGVTRRVGDKRKLKHSFCWIEFFPDRIRDEGLARG
ncbi:MAG: hypothetical protein ACRDKG_17005 [Actinomycetota bacterium]